MEEKLDFSLPEKKQKNESKRGNYSTTFDFDTFIISRFDFKFIR